MKRLIVPIILCLFFSVYSYSQAIWAGADSIKTVGNESFSTLTVNVVSWNGSVSSDWFDGANWTSVQGRPLLPPGINDIVEIGTQPFLNQPNINDISLIRNMVFGSVQSVSLTFLPGGSLSISEDLSGSWSADRIHSINLNNQNLTVNGNLVLSDGTVDHTIDLNINSGNINVSGSLTQAGNANITFIGTGVISIGKDFLFADGIFKAGDGTIVYNGSGSQIVAGVAYNHLTIKKAAGIASLLSEAVVSGNLSISAGELDVNGFLNSNSGISGNVLNIYEAATLKISGINGLPSFASYLLDSLSTVEYAGTNQIISGAIPYGNISISSAGTKTAGSSLTIRNNFSLSNGTFNGGNFSHKIGGNWNMTAGTFINSGTRILFNGSSNQNISSTGAFNNVTIQKTSGLVTISSNVTINSNLDFIEGKISAGNNILIISGSGTITGATETKYVIVSGWGNLTQGVFKGSSKLFPIGTVSNYTPATIALTSTSVSDNISVRVLNAMYSNGQSGSMVTANVVSTTWIITEGTTGGSNATVTLQWPQNLELNGFNRSYSVEAQFTGGMWNYGMGSTSATGSNPYTASRSGITTFSPFGLISFNPLPVRWLNFNGRNENTNNYLNWKTTNDEHTGYFIIEASATASDFTEIGRITNTFTNNNIHSFDFIHRNVSEKKMYYRIKQVDINQRFSYSSIIKIEQGNYLKEYVLLSPNPITNNGTVTIQSKNSEEVDLMIIDAEGRLIYKQQLALQKGINSFGIDFSKQPAGLYMLQIENNNKVKQVAKFIKK